MSEIRVMIVDDSAMMRIIIAGIVGKIEGAAVVSTCENGSIALTQLANARPDVILSDIEMPVMDGLTFLRQVRLRTRAAIIILSSVANLGNPNVEAAKKLGADAVMAKPSGSNSYDLEQKLGAQIQRLVKSLGAGRVATG
jgi:two-component system, chemotaxis family, protein-glutamate methylesterase/glutaminase